ncbi:MAG: hypothetical protein IBJ10_03565 [Phycisphaerales bacterium]|nr:hypothetical protein [Phycisphaerales bacterium]
MRRRPPTRLLLTLPLIAALGACANEPEPAAPASAAPAAISPVTLATWTPDAAVRVVTIERQSSFAVIEKDRDLFILRTEGTIDGYRAARVTWILSTPPAEAGPARYPLARVSHELERSGAAAMAGERWSSPPAEPDPGQAYGWAIIERDGWMRTTRPLTGEIEIIGMDTDHASIAVRLDTVGVADTLVFEGRCARVQRPHAVGESPIATRSGVPHRDPDEPEPRPTDPVWPWNEVFREPPREGGPPR